jgi:hypothetical protein
MADRTIEAQTTPGGTPKEGGCVAWPSFLPLYLWCPTLGHFFCLGNSEAWPPTFALFSLVAPGKSKILTEGVFCQTELKLERSGDCLQNLRKYKT